jgi:hypothetical protein
LSLSFSLFPRNAHTEANNRNAYDLALTLYKTQMDAAAGAEKPYMKEVELQGVHDALYIAAFQQFDEIATMGTCFGASGDVGGTRLSRQSKIGHCPILQMLCLTCLKRVPIIEHPLYLSPCLS